MVVLVRSPNIIKAQRSAGVCRRLTRSQERRAGMKVVGPQRPAELILQRHSGMRSHALPGNPASTYEWSVQEKFCAVFTD